MSKLALRLVDGRAQAGDIIAGGAQRQFSTLAYRPCGILAEGAGAIHIGLRLLLADQARIEGRAGLVQQRHGLGGVELHQHIAGRHAGAPFRPDLYGLPCYRRTDLYRMERRNPPVHGQHLNMRPFRHNLDRHNGRPRLPWPLDIGIDSCNQQEQSGEQPWLAASTSTLRFWSGLNGRHVLFSGPRRASFRSFRGIGSPAFTSAPDVETHRHRWRGLHSRPRADKAHRTKYWVMKNPHRAARPVNAVPQARSTSVTDQGQSRRVDRLVRS